MSRRPPIRELLLGAGLAIAIFACAPAPRVPVSDPRLADISTMDAEIRGFRRDMGLKSEPSFDMIRDARNYTLSPLCPDNEPDTQSSICETKCTLAQDICDNAENICRIADDLRGNSWARGKCDSARASCKEARQKCCGCTDKDDAADGTGTW